MPDTTSSDLSPGPSDSVSAAHATEAALDVIASCSPALRLCVSDNWSKRSKRNGAWRGKPERKQTSAASTADQTELLSGGNHTPSTVLPRFHASHLSFSAPSSNFIVRTPLRNSRTVAQKQVPSPGTSQPSWQSWSSSLPSSHRYEIKLPIAVMGYLLHNRIRTPMSCSTQGLLSTTDVF